MLRDVLNGESELTFETTADSVEAGFIREEYYVVGRINNVWREFIIDSIKEKDEGALIQEVKASLSSVELTDHLVLSKVKNMTLNTVINNILSNTRWVVGTIDSAIQRTQISEELQYMNVLEAIYEIARLYDCDVYFSYVVDTDKVVRRQVNLFKRLGYSNGKRFEIGKDVLSIERSIDTTMIKTAIYPIRVEESEENGTVITDISSVEWRVANGDPVDKPRGQKWVGDPNALKQWGRLDSQNNLIHRVKLYEFSEEVTPEVMLQMSWVSLGSYTKPKITYTTNIVDLYQLLGEEYAHEKVALGDTCVVIDNYFTVPIQTEDRVIELELDLIDPTKSKVMLGDPKASYRSDREATQDALNGAIDAAKDVAQGALDSANGKNTITYGSVEPRNPRTGDSWVRPHPDDPTETQWLIWDGTQWVIEIDTMRISDAVLAGEEALAAGEEAKQAGEAALAAGEEAKQAANDAREVADEAKLAAEEAKEIGENANLAAEEAKQVGEDAKQAASEAKQAGQEALEAGNTAFEKAEQAAQDAEEAKSAADAIAIDVEGVMKDVSEISNTAQSAFDKALAVEETAATLEKSVNGVTGRLIEVEETATGTTKKVNELEIKVDGQKQTIASAQETADSALSKANVIETTVDGTIQTVSKVKETADSALTKATQVETTAEGLKTAVSAVETTATSALTKATQVEQTASGIRQTVTEVQEDLDGLSEKTASQITQLSDTINLKVSKNDVVNQINVSTEEILISGNKVHITGTTTINNAVIKTAHIADLAVTNGKIANLSVDTTKIADAAITNAKIGNLAVNTAKISELAVTEAKIGNAAVTNAKIANLAVNTAKIGELAVTTGKIGQLAVTEAKIGNLAVTEGKIANLAVTNAKIANLAVDTAKIADAAITNAKISNLSADKINTGTLNAANVQIINLDVNRLTGNISQFIQTNWNAINSSLTIDGNGLTVGGTNKSLVLNNSGMHIWAAGEDIGRIRGNNWAGFSNARGLVFNLEFSGAYMAWSARDNANDTDFTAKLVWFKRNQIGNAIGFYNGFTFTDPVRFRGGIFPHNGTGRSFKIEQTVVGDNDTPAVRIGYCLNDSYTGTGLTFTNGEIRAVMNGTAYRLSRTIRVGDTLYGIGRVMIPTAINSNGTVQSWRTVTL
ncbi:hypothetical protein HED42_08900 [Enterococcus casseliflavus]|uniref:phage tail spike protein n=1 Tax=Enterococcus casseliflavus TaxID=37734 RepID=UPI0014333A84|nr:hypothetical protein [Enterococcus casseliflavus]